MPLREKQQMNLDTESSTHTGMEGQSRMSSHKYLLLQVWCGLLTVAMVVMAALFTSIKPKSTEDEVSSLKQDNVTPAANAFEAPFKSTGSSISYIQLYSPDSHSWQASPSCPSCSLELRNGTIFFAESGLYFIYAQVTFSKQPMNQQTKRVILQRNATFGRIMKTLVEGIFPLTTESSVWVGKIVHLTEGDSISLSIAGDFLNDNTFWGAFQLR